MFFFLLILQSANAQTNLVLNYSFEDYTTCPLPEDGAGGSFIIYTPPWYSPQEGTPDLFNECSNSRNNVPYSSAGFQYAKTGKGFGGFVWGSDGNCEYLTGRFSSPLVNGKKYCVEFYVNLANYSYYAFDRIGAYISVDSIHMSGGAYGYLHFIPQIENPAGNIITDTLNWTKISGKYTASGGEQFITIGNFRPDSLVQTLVHDTIVGDFPYYYLDDVSVYDCSDTTGINEIGGNNYFNFYPDPVKDIANIDYDVKTGANLILSIFGIMGNKLMEIKLDNNTQHYSFSTQQLKQGVYFYRITSGNNLISNNKFIIVK